MKEDKHMYMQDKSGKSKKGISIIIGYVLLVSFAIIIGVIVYAWMKTYVPQEEMQCPDGTSLFIKDLAYDCVAHTLTINFLNNGKYDVGGYFIYATTSPGSQLADAEISSANMDNTAILRPLGVKFGIPVEKNSLAPGLEEEDDYNLTAIGDIHSIEVLPIRWQTKNRKMFLATCTYARLRENVSCYEGCIKDSDATTCANGPNPDMKCGTIINNCLEEVDCGSCAGVQVCNSTGQCVNPAQCLDDCTTLGWVCGEVCGNSCENCPPFAHASALCSSGACLLGACDLSWENCDGNPANGCETPLGTQTDCSDCNDDCGAQTCVSGVCTSAPTSCDGTWTGASEDPGVECDDGILCLSNCICQSGAVPNYIGGCMYVGGSQSCILYCLDQNRLLGTDYTSSACVSNSGQCTSNNGDYLVAGDSQCAGAPSGLRCCCYPRQ
jgi:hypothetical protein